MDICRKHYRGDIAFEDSICPVCDEVSDLKSEIEDLKATIKKLGEEK